MLIPVADLAFHQQLGRLLTQLDEPAFWSRLAQCLGGVARFDNWVAMLFRPERPPLVWADFNANQQDEDLFSEYVRDVYLLDPFYQFAMNTPAPGLYPLDEVAPDDFRQTEYFRRYFLLNIVEDEVQYLIPVPGMGIASLSLGKKSCFDAQDIGGLALYRDWVLQLMKLHCLHRPMPEAAVADNHPDLKTRFEKTLAEQGDVHLTERETEIAVLVLSGHSTKGIAQRLGISLETVKVHRRNLYAKLGITTQAGLFLRFMSN